MSVRKEMIPDSGVQGLSETLRSYLRGGARTPCIGPPEERAV